MMRILLLSFISFISIPVISQISGEAQYITKINMHRKLPNNERGERMKAWIPEFQEFDNQLLFTDDETLYRNVYEEDEADLDENDREAWMKRRMAPPEDEIYCDVKNGLLVHKKEFMDKVFLIRDTLTMANWKITGHQKEIGGMNCLRAELIPKDKEDTTTTIAWFTTEIAISSGPAGYGGLPGLIVFIDYNDGEMQITLTNLITRKVAKSEIKEPKKGKEISQKDFDELKRKKEEERRKQFEGKGGWH